MGLPKQVTDLPPKASPQLSDSYEEARSALADVQSAERQLRALRKNAQAKVLRYENMVLEHLGQMKLFEEGHDG